MGDLLMLSGAVLLGGLAAWQVFKAEGLAAVVFVVGVLLFYMGLATR